jgi:Icc-related predicted phosphoesterase
MAARGDRRTVVAGIADIHVREGQTQEFCRLFAEISERADVLALCGDLTDLGAPHEATMLAECLRSVTIPMVGVLGNHDFESGEAEAVANILQEAGVCFLESRVHEFAGIGFAGVKGFAGGFGRYMLGAFGEPAIKRFVQEATDETMRLENSLRLLTAERIVVVLHYAPVTDTLEGEPSEIRPFLGSGRLAETIDRFSDRVAAVLHGHAHHGRFEGHTAGGVPVYNCAAMIEKPGGRSYAEIPIPVRAAV